MDFLTVISVLSRWLHVVSACVLIGGLFGVRVIAPRAWEDAGVARRLKLTLHAVAALLILTGGFNAWRAWSAYNLAPGLMHGIFGLHALIGLGVIALVEMAAARRRGAMLTMALVLAVVGVLVASTLKSMRERALARSAPPPAASMS